MWPTDATLAIVTGSSEKSVSRDIGQYETLGLLPVDRGWRRNREGKLVRTRTLIPSVPVDLKGSIDLPVIEDHTDNSGLFTLEEPMKGSRDNAA